MTTLDNCFDGGVLLDRPTHNLGLLYPRTGRGLEQECKSCRDTSQSKDQAVCLPETQGKSASAGLAVGS